VIFQKVHIVFHPVFGDLSVGSLLVRSILTVFWASSVRFLPYWWIYSQFSGVFDQFFIFFNQFDGISAGR
jgi:hypothetical protein